MFVAAVVLSAGVAAMTCRPTIPNGSQPPPEVLYSPEFSEGRLAEAYHAGRTRPDPHLHGNGVLWTVLTSDGRYLAPRSQVERDGAIGTKLPWWMARPGDMTLSARRLDAAAPPAKTSVGNSTEPRFHSSGIWFPTTGCWEVTARTRGSALTVVIDVEPADAP
ncbi:MAG: hypothetical protein QOF71_1840 [Candidatus Eremiobacteraeota bacterium]|nr:hypothetical protein [Candidatus Eremiobacteraeota bacterium]